MEQQVLPAPVRFLRVLRVVALAGFALADPPIPAKALAAAILWVGAASVAGGLRLRERRTRAVLLAGMAAVDLAWVAAAFAHFGPTHSLPAVIYAAAVAALTASASWGIGVVIGCFGALVYYTLTLISRAPVAHDGEGQFLTFQASLIAIAGVLGGYFSGQTTRLRKAQVLASRLERLNAATANLVEQEGDAAVLRAAVERAAEVMEAERAWVLLAEPEAQTLTLDAHIGVSPPAGTPTTTAMSSGLAGLALQSGDTVAAFGRAHSDPRLSAVERALTRDHLMAAAIPDADRPLGVIAVSRDGTEAFGEGDLAVLTALARAIGAAMRTTRLVRHLQETVETDSLTGLYNHGAFLEQLGGQILKARGGDGELSLVIFDVDHFKGVNDVAGHWYGDRVLQALATTLRQQCRTTDVIARCGGDEFGVLLPGTGAEEAVRIAERVATALRQAGEEMGLSVPVGASFGVASFPRDAEDDAGLFRRADARLYEAKQAPRSETTFQAIVA